MLHQEVVAKKENGGSMFEKEYDITGTTLT